MNNIVALPAQGRRVHMYGTLSRLANPVGRAETTRENEVATMIRPVGPLRALGRWRRPLAVVAVAAAAVAVAACGTYPGGRAALYQPAPSRAPAGGAGAAARRGPTRARTPPGTVPPPPAGLSP